MSEAIYRDEIERVAWFGSVLYMPVRALAAMPEAGEWDWLRAMPMRRRRSLLGAGFLSALGTPPDVAADWIAAAGGPEGVDAAMSWFVDRARRAIAEDRRAAHHRRHERHARALGFPTYYALRNARAVESGHGSLWNLRVERGWT